MSQWRFFGAFQFFVQFRLVRSLRQTFIRFFFRSIFFPVIPARDNWKYATLTQRDKREKNIDQGGGEGAGIFGTVQTSN